MINNKLSVHGILFAKCKANLKNKIVYDSSGRW